MLTNELSRRLDALATLGDNWNGGGEEAPTFRALETVGMLHFCPLPNGGIQVEVHRGGVDIEFVVNPDGSLDPECPCADCDLPAWHDESPDPADWVSPPIAPKDVKRYRMVPIEDEETDGPAE